MERERALTYVKIFVDFAETVNTLAEDERGRLFSAILDYAATGKHPRLRGNERFVFPIIKTQIDRDAAAYDVLCGKRREAGARGGRGNKKTRKAEGAADCGDEIDGDGVGCGCEDEAVIVDETENGNKDTAPPFLTGQKANAFLKSNCKQEKEKDNDNDEDKDEDKEKENENLCETTTTARARKDTSHGSPVETVENSSSVENIVEKSCGAVDKRLKSSDGGESAGENSGECGRNACMPPTAAEVAHYFDDELFIEDALKQAKLFVSYNESIGWRCLPDWKYYAKRWAAQMRNDAMTKSVGLFYGTG